MIVVWDVYNDEKTFCFSGANIYPLGESIDKKKCTLVGASVIDESDICVIDKRLYKEFRFSPYSMSKMEMHGHEVWYVNNWVQINF